MYPINENDLGSDCIFRKSNKMVDIAGSKKNAMLGATKLGKSLAISTKDMISPMQSTMLPYMRKAKS